MPPVLFDAFVGGTYQAQSATIAADQAINVYVETRTVPGSPKQSTLYGTPGLVLDATVATTVSRGWFTLDGRTWVTVGATLYERTGTATYVARGTLANDGNLVSYASNGAGGNQLGIVAAGVLYVLNLGTNALSTVSLPFSNPVTLTFQDGYGLINQGNTPIVWFSALEDLTNWDAFDFFTRSGTPDNVVTIATVKDRVVAIGTRTTTLYYDSGDADTPWIPYPGTTIQVGIVTPTALAIYSDVLYWVAQSNRGTPRVVQYQDGLATTISTPPIDRWLAGCTTLTDIEPLVYEQAGHVHVSWTCPSATDAIKTRTFDAKEGLWHGRASWNTTTGAWQRWRAKGVTAINGTVYVGDATTGKLGILDLETFTEYGAMFPAERIAPYLSAQAQWLFLDQVQLGTQAGIGIPSGQGSAPTIELLISRDGTSTWISAGVAPLGALGAYLTRTIWRRLGRVRSDLLALRVRQTDPVRRVWGPGMWLTFDNGTGQL